MRLARLVALLTSIVFLVSAAPVGAQREQVIRIGTTAGDAYAEAYYAQELGLFRQAGLRVELRMFSSGVAIATGVASGTIDLGIANVIYLAKTISGGTPLVFLAGGGLYSSKTPIIALVTKRNSPLHGPRDLEGKTVAIAGRSDQSLVAIDAWMDRGGADFTKVHFIYIPLGEMQFALRNGLADAAMITEPWLSAAVKSENLQVVAKPHDALGSQLVIGVWFSTAQWYATNKELAKKFITIIYEAGSWANAHHYQSAQLLAKFSKIDIQTIGSMVRAPFPTMLDPSIIQGQLNLAYRYHILDRPMSAVDLLAK
ncbi:MAG TPA: ABC transporter substrate-binding protein [Candidatus Binatia bacterium]|nr:ABC transporter substrate-binding protein [Candidatus Binatia bacterium]